MPAPAAPFLDDPLASTAQPRGLCLLVIEFLTRYPASEVVVTAPSLDFWGAVFDLFPKCLFHAFLCEPEDPPRPNVIRHAARFDSELAARFGARGAAYNLICSADDMETQLALHVRGRPAASMLLVTQPAPEYLDGELAFPLHCSASSGLCALVPWPGQPRFTSYAGYYAAVQDFHASERGPGSAYDRAAEDAILRAYAQGAGETASPAMAALQAEVARSQLPALQAEDALYWEPPPPETKLDAGDVLALLELLSDKKSLPQIAPNGLVGQPI